MQKCFGLFLHLTKNFKTAFAPKLCWSSPYLLILTKLCGCISRQIIYEHLGSAKSTREIRLLLKSQQNRALLMCPFVNLFDKWLIIKLWIWLPEISKPQQHTRKIIFLKHYFLYTWILIFIWSLSTEWLYFGQTTLCNL